MKWQNHIKLFCFLLIFFLLSFLHVEASDSHNTKKKGHLRIDFSSSSLRPGDAFSIKIKGARKMPHALFNENDLPFNTCGRKCFFAIGAIDISTPPGNYNISLTIGKKRLSRHIQIRKADFSEVYINLSEDKVSLSDENLERAKTEENLLKSIWEIRSEKLWKGSFIHPVENDLLTPFGKKRIFNNKTVSIHKGVDIRSNTGDEIKASNNGRVVLTEELFFGGNTIILDHGLGIFSVYMHLSAFNVKPGDLVEKGAVIGYVGSSGRSTGPHLHFGIKVQSVSVNPLSFLDLDI